MSRRETKKDRRGSKDALTAQLDIKASDPIHVSTLTASRRPGSEIEEEKSGEGESSSNQVW